eukprot:scaffold15140_cov63-Cyclotella_meneghiniana.AAC.6
MTCVVGVNCAWKKYIYPPACYYLLPAWMVLGRSVHDLDLHSTWDAGENMAGGIKSTSTPDSPRMNILPL